MKLKSCHSKLFVLLFVALYACNKNPQTTCVPKKNYLTSFVASFHFKPGSYWLYQSSTNSNIDSMNVVNNPIPPTNWNRIAPPQHTMPDQNLPDPFSCISFEVYTIALAHMGFIGGDYINYGLNYDNLYIGGAPGYYPLGQDLILINPNSGLPDTASYAANRYVKLENTFDTLTVLGSKYNNVYQMYYSPSLYNFQRIWWCPNIGFVKFEFVNLSGGIDTWELKKSHIVM